MEALSMSKKYSKKISKHITAATIYYLATIIVVTKLILAYSELIVLPEIVNDGLNYIFIALMGIKIVLSSGTKIKKQYIIILLIAIISLYSSIIANNYFILMSTLGVAALKGMNVRQIVKVAYATKVFWLSIHFICYLFAQLLIPSIIHYSVIDGIVRGRIFLSQPNTCAMLFVWAALEYLYLKFEKIKFYEFAVSLIITGIVFIITDSKTSMIVYLLFWILFAIKENNLVKKIILFFSKYGYILLTVFCVTFTVLYNVLPIAKIVNTMLTGRLAGSAKAYSLYGFTLMGQYLDLENNAEWDSVYGVERIWLENSYTAIFINYGIIYGIVIAIALFIAAKHLSVKAQIFVCLMLVYGISESYIINIYLCFPLLLVADVFINRKKFRKIGENK